MNKQTTLVFNKNIILIVFTHLLFFILILCTYYCVNLQQQQFVNLNTPLEIKSTKYLSQFETSHISIKNNLLIVLILIIISLVSYIIYVNKKIFYPIKLIRSALETGSKKCIKLLKTIPGEFNAIGNLFQENNNHKFELVSAKINAEESERLKSTFLENLSHEI